MFNHRATLLTAVAIVGCALHLRRQRRNAQLAQLQLAAANRKVATLRATLQSMTQEAREAEERSWWRG